MSVTAFAFVGSYVVGLLLALFRHPRWGLFTYIGATFVDPESKWWGGALPSLRWSLIASVALVVSLILHKSNSNSAPWTSSRIVILLLCYLAWMFLQTLWAFPGHIGGCILFAKYALLMWVLYRLLVSDREIRGLVIAFVLGCLYFGYLIYDAPEAGRIEGIGGSGFNDANTLGAVLSSGLVAAVALFFESKGGFRAVVVVVAVFIANGVIQTQSRGALVGLLAGGAVFYAMANKLERRRLWPVLIVGLICGMRYVPANYIERMTNTVKGYQGETELDESADSRSAIFRAQLHMFMDYPMGVGYRGTVWLSPMYIERRYLAQGLGARASHSTLGSVLVDQGVVGIALYIGITLSFFGTVIRCRRMTVNSATRMLLIGATSSLSVVFVAGLASNFLFLETQFWFVALVTALERNLNAESRI